MAKDGECRLATAFICGFALQNWLGIICGIHRSSRRRIFRCEFSFKIENCNLYIRAKKCEKKEEKLFSICVICFES